MADEYVRMNKSIQPHFLKIVFSMSLEVAIKNNEQMVLALSDIVQLY